MPRDEQLADDARPRRPRRQVAHDHRRHDHPRGLYSAVRQTAMQDAGVAPYQEVGVPSPGLVHTGSTAEAPPAAAATTTESVRRFRAPTSEEPLSASATQEA